VTTLFASAEARDIDGIRGRPDLLASARALIHSLARCPDDDARVAVLKRVAKRLGDANYPVFIKVLTVVGESDDTAAKRLLADTLVSALLRGDLPSGSLTGWGSAGAWADGAAGALPASSFLRSPPRRLFDPIEYLTAWYSQTTDRVRLRPDLYAATLAALMSLFEGSGGGARAYGAKLADDAANQPEGTFAEITRARLFEIARAWSGHALPVGADRV
jgi:hypothetical protein